MKNLNQRIKRLEDRITQQVTNVDSDDTGDMFEILQGAAEGGDLHAKARLEVFKKLLTILGPSIKAAEEIASTIPAELEDGTARRRARQKEMFHRDSCDYQLFEEFVAQEMICPDDEDPEEIARRPFVDNYTSR